MNKKKLVIFISLVVSGCFPSTSFCMLEYIESHCDDEFSACIDNHIDLVSATPSIFKPDSPIAEGNCNGDENSVDFSTIDFDSGFFDANDNLMPDEIKLKQMSEGELAAHLIKFIESCVKFYKKQMKIDKANIDFDRIHKYVEYSQLCCFCLYWKNPNGKFVKKSIKRYISFKKDLNNIICSDGVIRLIFFGSEPSWLVQFI